MRINKRTNNLVGLSAIGLAVLFVMAVIEIKAVWPSEQVQNSLQDPLATSAVIVYIPAAVLGLSILALGLFSPDYGGVPFERFRASVSLRWSLVSVTLLFIQWVTLVSNWRAVLTAPWTQFLFAIGLAAMIGWIFDPRRSRPLDGKDLGLALFLFLYPRVAWELQIIFQDEWLIWPLALGGYLSSIILVALLYNDLGEKIRLILMRWREHLGQPRWLFTIPFILMPVLIRYGIGAGFYILYPNLRFAAILFALWMVAYILCAEPERLVSLESIAKSGGALILVSAITRALMLVVDDPFSLSWSEGNRLYDYSLVFGQNLYNYDGAIPDPYNTPGRYGLWGVLFLWPGLPIWAHRLWNVILLTLPSILLACALTRKLKPPSLRTVVFFWVSTFFIVLAPLHPPFMLVAITVAAFAFHASPIVRCTSLVAASLYAGISRWTWVVAPGAWGALADLILFYPARKGNWIQRLLPTIMLTLFGFLPGFLLNFGNFFGYSTGESATAQQPLLWYRLLPNETLGPGILFLAVVTTGPVIALLAYKMWTRQWQLDAFQSLAIWGILLGFLAAGLVISTKIGGGGDLHNLDMYIVTLVIVSVLGLTVQYGHSDRKKVKNLVPSRWPAWVLALLCWLAIQPLYPFTPFGSSVGYDAWLEIPTEQESAKALQAIRVEVANAAQRGEVLFMDQRQLLTFGYIREVPFVPQYEKKYMMDQSLSSNSSYFEPYYRDLAAQRFALIVTEPLKTGLKGGEGIFADENDLWVFWVSAPTLCFYEPVMTDRAVGVQMLVPRENPEGCEKYVHEVLP